MPKPKVNAKHYDPYKNFKFRVKLDGKYVAGFSKCSALKKTTEMTEWRDGGDPGTSHKILGKTKFDALTLITGVAHNSTFLEWVKKVNNHQGDATMSLQNFRKDITIDVFNEANQRILSYHVYRCWVSEYKALPELDASGNAVMIQAIKLENEGRERDPLVTEPTEK